MPLVLLLVFVILIGIALIPVGIIQRYRRGSTRQRARGWLAALNIAGLTASATLFLASAAMTNIWVADAVLYTAGGLATGAILGMVALMLTRWEPGPGGLHFTPNRWLTLVVTTLVAARLLYGFWRAWHTWRAGLEDGSWIAATGVAGAMGAGAVVLGYYLAFWIGVRSRLKRAQVTIRATHGDRRPTSR
jgi:hypothetical protein